MNGFDSSREGKDSRVDGQGRDLGDTIRLENIRKPADAPSSRTLRSAAASILGSERKDRKRPLPCDYEGKEGPPAKRMASYMPGDCLRLWKVPTPPNPFVSKSAQRTTTTRPNPFRAIGSGQFYSHGLVGGRRSGGSRPRTTSRSVSKAKPCSSTGEGRNLDVEILEIPDDDLVDSFFESQVVDDNHGPSKQPSRERIAPAPSPRDANEVGTGSATTTSDQDTSPPARRLKMKMKGRPPPKAKRPDGPLQTYLQLPKEPLPRVSHTLESISSHPTPSSSATMNSSPHAAGPSRLDPTPSTQHVPANASPSADAAPSSSTTLNSSLYTGGPSTVSTTPSTSQLVSAHNTPSATAAPNVPILAYRQHERHWNRDGNLIVVIGGVGYKLHQSRVAKLSKWFSALIAEASDDATGSGIFTYQGKGKERMVESDQQIRRRAGVDGRKGILRVELDEVEERDWETLVDALDDAITYFQNPPSLNQVYAILRAARALSFPAFESWAKTIVQDAWSDDLKRLGEPLPQGADPVEAMTVGRRCGMPTVLKRAIYELLKDELFYQDADDAHEADGDEGGGGSNAVLSTKVILLLTSARAKLQSSWVRETAQFPDALLQPPNCGGPCTSMDANAAHTAHRELVIRSGVQERYMNDVIGGFGELAEGKWAQKGFCPTCVGTLRAGWRASTDRVWGECDELFGLVR